ncbi:unnamed protein product [marine sediment metagenome]|uniref:Uncharacterized protein n=1 Tax=marine sediment metagenome TaxID=412755 RepID=X1AEL2_9ZZZZ
MTRYTRPLIDLVSPFVEIVEKPKTARLACQVVPFQLMGGTGLGWQAAEPTASSV